MATPETPFEGFVLVDDLNQHSGPVDVIEVHDNGASLMLKSIDFPKAYVYSGQPVDVYHWRDNTGEHVDCRLVDVSAATVGAAGVECAVLV